MTKKDDEELQSAALQTANSIQIARQRAEQRNEAYLAEAQRLSRTGSFGWRVSTGEILWSEETFRIFQYDRTTTPTLERVLQRVHPEDAALVKGTIERASQDLQDFALEHRLLMPDGSVKHVKVVAHAMSDEASGVEFVGAVMDVTGQHRSTAALEKALDEIQKSQNRLRLVINTIPGMVWSGLPDGSFDFVNQPWLSYLDCSWEELSARGGILSVVHPDDVEEGVARWKASRATGRHTDQEVRLRRADGQYRWFLSRALPLRDEDGTIVRWYGTVTDIDDRKRAEMLLAGEKRLLQMIARGDSQALVLDALCRLVEELATGSLSSILLLDPSDKRLRHGAAPSLPTTYTEAIDGSVIGPSAGSWGTAAYRSEPVIVSDLLTDPLWADYRDLAAAHGLRACWSTPILSSERRVLGTFAIYYREPRSPTSQEQKVIEQVTHLASIALERAQSGEALREQASLLDLTHDSIFVRDVNDVITYWNRGAEDLYGWKREEALGKVTHELLRTIFPAPLDEITAQLLQAGRWSGELIHTKRDGTEAIVASRWSLQRDEQGRPVATLETNNDVTERKQAEEAMARQANLLEQTHDAIFVWEFRGPIRYWNRGAAELYGFSKQEAIGRLTHELLHTVHPLPVPVFESVLERRGEWAGELTQTTRDGRRIIVESRHVLLRQADGRQLVLESNRDITERRDAEDAVRKAQAELTHVARVTTMGEMAASIAHEVNQPLSGVVINANASLRWLAASSPNLDEARDALQRIVRDGRRASEVVARIRALSKKTGGEKEPLDLNEVIQEVVALAQGEVRRTRVVLRTELADTLPRVLGDRVQLQQVVLNLVLNAVEAMSDVADRPRALVIRTEKDEAERVRVVVRDSGAGLDPENANRIFDAFYTTKRGGMGMGLSISRSIVENHGGRLWAVPNDGPGTTFQFTV